MNLNRLASVLSAMACVAVFACPGAFSQEVLSSERRATIESQLSRWQEVKAAADRTKNQFLSNIAKDSRLDYQSFRSFMGEAWSLCERIERKELVRKINLSRRLVADYSDGKISSDELARRTEILSKIFQIRMLFIYGNMLPRVIDESTGKRPGRAYAGPEWGLLLTEKESQSLNLEYETLSGFPLELFNDNP